MDFIKSVPHNDVDTSRESAKIYAGKAEGVRRQIYELFLENPDGFTCDEVESITGLSHQTASARLNDLQRLGHIVNSGKKRKTRSGRNARVYVVFDSKIVTGLDVATCYVKRLKCSKSICKYNQDNRCFTSNLRI